MRRKQSDENQITETNPDENINQVDNNVTVETQIDEGDKKLRISRSELRELGLDVDPSVVEIPVDPDGNPKYAYRWCHEMHRKPRGGIGSWQVADWKFVKQEKIKFPNNPVSEHIQHQCDNKVYMMDHFLCYRPIEVNKKVRKYIDDKSSRNVEQANNMEAVAESIRQQFGSNEAVKVMDAMMKVKGKKFY